jgi:hypothetical protein
MSELESVIVKQVQEIEQLKSQLSRSVEMDLKFQEYIPFPPVQNKEHLYSRACGNDHITVTSWFDQWISQLKANSQIYDFKKLSVMNEYTKNALKPCIIAGSGPSLKKNVKELSNNKGDMCLVSCLHNFAFFEDNNVKPDYYLNLDAGDITISELAEGGKEKPDYYWEKTKDFTLVTVVNSHPELLNKWQGEILFFNVIVPDQTYIDKMKEITDFNVVFNVGGNALGACLYFAKAILGSNPIAFIGADFCFSYNKKFHSWDSPYDQKYAGLTPWTDIFGNRVYSWASYINFKCWFDYIVLGGKGNNPGIYINCTEGGILGAYPEGNIRQIQQWSLSEFLFSYNSHKMLPDLIKDNDKFALLF